MHPAIREALLAEHRRDLAEAAAFAYLTMGAKERKRDQRAATRPPRRRWFAPWRAAPHPC